MARGSWKKLWAPGCHSELSTWVMGAGRGISATMVWPAGLPTLAICGASPIFSRRDTAEQADRAAPVNIRVAIFRMLRMVMSYRRAIWLVEAEIGPVARTVPGAVTVPEIMR